MKISKFYTDVVTETKAIKSETLDVLVPKLGELLYDLLKKEPYKINGMPEMQKFRNFYSEWYNGWASRGRNNMELLEFVKDYLEQYINYNLSDSATTKFVRMLKVEYPELDLKIKQLFNPEYMPRAERQQLKAAEKEKIAIAQQGQQELEKETEELKIQKAQQIMNKFEREINMPLNNLKNIIDDINTQELSAGGKEAALQMKQLEKYVNQYQKMQRIMNAYENEMRQKLSNLKGILQTMK
jgi:hypothetical protein